MTTQTYNDYGTEEARRQWIRTGAYRTESFVVFYNKWVNKTVASWFSDLPASLKKQAI